MANTWTYPAAALDPDRQRVAAATCTTGTEVPQYVPGEGLDLKGLQAVQVAIEGPRATGTATCTGVAPGQTLVVNGVAFTAVAASPGPGQFLVGASDVATAANLAAAIATSRLAGVVGAVTATAATNVVTIVSIVTGPAGNTIALAQAGGAIALSGATLAGGVVLVIGATATLAAYVVNPATGTANRAPDLDVTLVAGLASQSSGAYSVNGGAARVLWLPSGVGAACTVFVMGSPRPTLLGG